MDQTNVRVMSKCGSYFWKPKYGQIARRIREKFGQKMEGEMRNHNKNRAISLEKKEKLIVFYVNKII